MQLEEYFEFLTPNDIRIKGTRVGIETILDEYLEGHKTAEQIAAAYSSLTLEQVYAAILYYLHERDAVERYLKEWSIYCREAEAAYNANPPDLGLENRSGRPVVRVAS